MKYLVIFMISIGLFLTVGMFLVAPIGFYSGLPELTSFMPISLVLGFGCIAMGGLYYFLEKKQTSHSCGIS